MKKMTCNEARKIDLVEYLTSIGHNPKKIRKQDYWYLSPLREEKTPSFKVNRLKGLWFDFGTGLGGDVIDFGIKYHQCSVSDLLKLLTESNPAQLLLFHLHSSISETTQNAAGEKQEDTGSKIIVSDIRPLTSSSLLQYLKSRCIPFEIARRFCREVDFVLYGKKQTVIGFQNDLGGYELRNLHFKGSSSPKTIRFIDNGSPNISVFEGFFSFLSFQTINEKIEAPITNCLVLNSLSFFEKSRELMEKHKTVNLFLDRDKAGMTNTTKALALNKSIYIGNNDFYKDHKDLNDWLIANQKKFNLAKCVIQK
jgi:DNA primase